MKNKKVPVHIPSSDGRFCMEDYTFEWCPNCEKDVVIYSKGITACPSCGEPLAPCSQCEDCNAKVCPYNCAGSGVHLNIAPNNPPISVCEQGWFAILDILLTARKGG